MMKSTNLYIFIILFILFSIPLKKKACVVCANSHVFCAISHTFNKVKKRFILINQCVIILARFL